MAKVVQLRPQPKSEESPPDALSLATLYAMRRAALDEGDLDRVAEIDEEARQLLDSANR